MNDATMAVQQDSKNMGLLIWILTLFFGFIPGLIFFLVKKEDDYIQDQAKESLNWSITVILGYLVGALLSLVVIGVFVMLAVGIAHMVFCIMGAIAASSGKPFRAPFAIRLIK
jgi:uncharacterized Tic20 family protein